MAKICPRCGGFEVGCPVCNLPPKRQLPKDNLLRTVLYKLYSPFSTVNWEVQGVDVSSWNGVMDFNITKKKCQFAIVRLGYGNGYKDPRCDTYRQQLIDADMPYGGYWFNYIGYDYNAHAEGFAEVASEYPFQLNMEEDFEWTNLGLTGTLNWIISYDKRLKSLMPAVTTSPYSSLGFWNENVAYNNYFTDEQWVANWTLAPLPYMPSNWVFKKGCKWQWSADGNRKAKEYGMIRDGDVDMDLDRYFGTVNDFNARFGTHILPIGEVPPEPPQDEIKPIKYIFINTGALNVRSTPNVTSTNDIGTVQYNDDFGVTKQEGDWLKIEGWIHGGYTRPKTYGNPGKKYSKG
jgi:GH25 family lysozyme M1 (1,4-beta-N-acetylmuramidase)